MISRTPEPCTPQTVPLSKLPDMHPSAGWFLGSPATAARDAHPLPAAVATTKHRCLFQNTSLTEKTPQAKHILLMTATGTRMGKLLPRQLPPVPRQAGLHGDSTRSLAGAGLAPATPSTKSRGSPKKKEESLSSNYQKSLKCHSDLRRLTQPRAKPWLHRRTPPGTVISWVLSTRAALNQQSAICVIRGQTLPLSLFSPLTAVV